MDVGHIADDLLTQMYHNSKKAPGSPAAAGPSGTTAPTATTGDARAATPPRQG